MNKPFSILLALVIASVVAASILYFDKRSENDAKPIANVQRQKEAIQIPDQQAEFCLIIEKAILARGILMQQWSVANDQKNGIVTQQLSKQMTSGFRSRNEDIFRLLERTKFGFENWLVTVERIDAPIGTNVEIRVHPFCSQATTIYATAMGQGHIELLSKRKMGDRLRMSGLLVATGTRTQPSSPEKFEKSFTEDGSITAPEYTAILSQLAFDSH